MYTKYDEILHCINYDFTRNFYLGMLERLKSYNLLKLKSYKLKRKHKLIWEQKQCYTTLYRPGNWKLKQVEKDNSCN